jgi:hypothetical protein
MNTKLKNALRGYVVENGRGAKERVALEADVSVHLIEKILNTTHTPKPENERAIRRALKKLNTPRTPTPPEAA